MRSAPIGQSFCALRAAVAALSRAPTSPAEVMLGWWSRPVAQTFSRVGRLSCLVTLFAPRKHYKARYHLSTNTNKRKLQSLSQS